jgi:hypothetical protein
LFAGALKGKLLVAIAAAIAALALGACGGGSSDSGSTTSSSSGSGSGDQFTTASLQQTLDVVKGKSGADAELLEVQITTGGTDYQIRDGEKATGFHFDPGSSDAQDVQVDVVGVGSLDNSAYPISEVDPAAIDKMVAGAPQASGADDFKVTVMTLGKSFSPDLQWTVNGEASGRTGLVLNAKPDGSGLTSPTGQVPSGTDTSGGAGATPTAPGGQDPAAIADCISKAGGDVNKIQACAAQ